MKIIHIIYNNIYRYIITYNNNILYNNAKDIYIVIIYVLHNSINIIY